MATNEPTTEWCSAHPYNRASQARLDPIMVTLPRGYAGMGYHRCTYCAYQRGWVDAVAQVRVAIDALAEKFPMEPTDGDLLT